MTMNRQCYKFNRCSMYLFEVCPFGRSAEPSEDEYKTARNKCKFYQPKERDYAKG